MKKSQLNDILKNLEDDEKYYGDFGKQFLSNSNIEALLTDPLSMHLPKPANTNLVKGSYFHTLVLEPGKLNRYKIIDAKTRNNAEYRELTNPEICLLQHEADMLQALNETLMANETAKGLIQDIDVEYEIPGLLELEGEWWKCKTDIKNNTQGIIVDLKTSGDITRFEQSARNYNYDSQAYIYSSYFKMDFIFLVIDKKTKKIGIFDCSPQFLERGKFKVEEAAEQYRLYYKDQSFDPKNYFISKTL
jgi:hypothetical protein